ncbi:MAG: hypothetical protein AAGC85_10220 [Bacteroidota bacterium]
MRNLLGILVISASVVISSMSSCKSSLEVGKVTYEITPGLTEAGIPEKEYKPRYREVYFDESYVIELPIFEKKIKKIPGLVEVLANGEEREVIIENTDESFSFHNWRTGKRFQVKDLYGATFLVDMNDSHSRNYELKPIPGRKKISGYTCKGATIISPIDTATIWYTTKLKVDYAPWLFSIPEGFVLQIEEPIQFSTLRFQRDVLGAKEELIVKMLIDKEDKFSYPGDSTRTIEWATRITTAIQVEEQPFGGRIPFDDSKIKRIKEDELNGFGYLNESGYSLEQLKPGEPLEGIEMLKNEFELSGELVLLYAFNTYEKKVEPDLQILHALREKYKAEKLDMIVVSNDTYLGDLTFPHISNKKNWLEDTGLFIFPSFVLIDKEGNVIESVFSYLKGAEAILNSLIHQSIETQPLLPKE